jgi:hypothetical protein
MRCLLPVPVLLLLGGCVDTGPTPSEQLDADLDRVAEESVQDIDTTGFDLLE